MQHPEASGFESIRDRAAKRIAEIQRSTDELVSLLEEQHVSERAITGYLSTIGYINMVVGSTMIDQDPLTRENFIIELQAAIRTLAHGLSMGDASQRQKDHESIASHHHKLRDEIDKALRRANGTGVRGPDETFHAYESEL